MFYNHKQIEYRKWAQEQNRLENEKIKQEKEALLAKEAEDSFYQKIADGFDVNILIIGDSIGAGAGASQTNNTWANRLKNAIHRDYDVRVEMTNVSMGGNSSYAGYARTITLEDNIDYDLAIICYGENDPVEGFSLYYESIIRAIKNKDQHCSIISILESSQRDYTEKMKIIEQLANYYGYPIVDTIAPFKDDYDALAIDDRIHPNDEGHKLYFEEVYKRISELINEYREGDPEGVSPYNPEVMVFDTYRSIPASEFVRLNDTTYSIDIKISGILGFDYRYQGQFVEGKMDIYIDDALFMTLTDDLGQRYIRRLSDDCTVNKSIKIVFETKEAADNFNGLYFSGID